MRHTIGKGPQEPWITNASFVLMKRVPSMTLVPPHGLEDFLDPDRDDCSVRVIHGPKGSGKSSVLLAKRLLLREREEKRHVVCIPPTKPFVFMAFADTDKVELNSWDVINSFSRSDTWSNLWKVVFGAYVVAALERDIRVPFLQEKMQPWQKQEEIEERHPLLPPELGDFLFGKRYANGMDVGKLPANEELLEILRHLIVERKVTSAQLRDVFTRHVQPTLERLSQIENAKPIYIFVDGVDEMLQGYQNDPSMLTTAKGAPGQADVTVAQRNLAMRLWVYAQRSLLTASLDLSSATGDTVRLIASMRTEAYDYEVFTKGRTQLATFVKEVRYTRAELDEIFRANIAVCDKKRYVNPTGDELTKFFGASTYRHWATNKDEDVFSAILRHTLEEPRDLMLMGRKLYDLGSEVRRDPREAAREVNSATEMILADYLDFMGEAWDADLADITFSKVPTNVLTSEDVRVIAGSIARDSNGEFEHPFCYLYSLGFIGIPKPIGDGKLIQEFLLPARFPPQEGKFKRLPPASHYLIHPVLTERIRMARRDAGAEFVTNGQVIVGNDLPWDLFLDTTKVVLDLHKNGNNKNLKPIIRIEGHEVGYDEETQIKRHTFSDFSDFGTVVVVAILLGLARNAKRGTPNDHVTVDELCDAIDYLVAQGYARGVMSGARKMATVLRQQLGKYRDEKVYPKILQKVNLRMQANGVEGTRIGLLDGGEHLFIARIARSDVQVRSFDNWS